MDLKPLLAGHGDRSPTFDSPANVPLSAIVFKI
jgi:hypothetical protein